MKAEALRLAEKLNMDGMLIDEQGGGIDDKEATISLPDINSNGKRRNTSKISNK